MNRPERILGDPAARGTGLTEVMVAMAIGLVLSAVTVVFYTDAKQEHSTHDSAIRMLENARSVVRLLREDIRMAGHWGFNYQPSSIGVAETISIASECTPGWATAVHQAVEVLNNTNTPYTSCLPDLDYAVGTDVLTVRRAAGTPVPDAAISAGDLYLRTSLTRGVLFIAEEDGTLDGGIDIPGKPVSTYRVQAHAYYVRPWSRNRSDGIPTLVRETLGKAGVAAEPLAEHIEDLQVTLGFDTDSDGAPDLYDNDGSEAGQTTGPITVTVEILVRTPHPEPGHRNQHSYTLGDRNTTVDDGFRRLHLREAVYVRNGHRHWSQGGPM